MGTTTYSISDMALMGIASSLLYFEDYAKIREQYIIRNPRKYVNADTHRRIMQEALGIAKTITGSKATDDEVRAACLYLYICVDSRKYRLAWGKARKDLKIDDLVKKYVKDIPEEVKADG